jgi:thiamine biosynthesis lipoprotein
MIGMHTMSYCNQTTARRLIRASFLFVVISVLIVSACSKAPESLSLNGATMGTTYHITIVIPPEVHLPSLTKLQILIDKELLKINQLMSTYIPNSEISLFNQLSVDEWYPISGETLGVLNYSKSLSELSEGKFDITVSPLINLWGFGAKGEQAFPDDDAIAQARAKVGWESLLIDDTMQRIKKQKPLTINLSAVAKGYGVDYITKILESKGINNYLVEIGGEIRVKGKNQRQLLWKIGVESPSLFQSGVQKVISVDNKSVATSGDYRNFFEKDGIRYSHTIDPYTGKPVVHNIASITVVADTAMEADGLATTLMVMGEEKALALATQLNIPIYILLYKNDTFSVSYSPSFSPYLQQ